MKKTIKAALKGITTATAGFLKKRGIYVVALALISAAALSAVRAHRCVEPTPRKL